jgi:two-component system phosphate regulon sensor histidine kinase PhoR
MTGGQQVTQQSEKPSKLSQWLRHYASLNIGGKIVLPYLLLTLVVAIIGVYVVTNLVVTSLEERFKNQLIDTGTTISDGMARQEIEHLESARAVAFTVGLAEALQAGDRERVIALAQPQAAVRGVECLVIADAQSEEVLHGLRRDDGAFEIVEGFDPADFWMVEALLDAGDPDGLPKRSLGLHLLNQRYYYFTAIPVGLEDDDQVGVVGVVVVGTSLDTLLPLFKIRSLADVTFYLNDGQAIASTFALDQPAEETSVLKVLSITPALYQSILSSPEVVMGENDDIRGRSYGIARGPLRVGNDTLGVFSVALPANFIIEQRATNRNGYIAIFAIVTVGVVVIGFLISRLITTPLGRLVRTSQAVAEGDLEQRTGIKQADEIGILATTFDQMTGRLAERTRALEETLGRMQAILSSIGDGVLLEDLEHNLIPLNGAAQVLLREMTENFMVDGLHELTAESREEEPSLDSWLMERRRFEIGKKIISAHSAAVRAQDGEYLGTVIVLRDVTSEAEADRLKDAFVAHVSHELRTPLTAIKGYSELMLIGATGSLEDEQRRFIQTIHHHTDSLVSMINTLLDFSELEAWDKLTLARHPTQLSALLEETIEPWYLQMDEKQLTFNVEISDGLPLVDVDTKRLQWVIVNLVRNAWQYTPEDGSVSVRLYERNGTVVLDVADTGIGISEKDQEELFTRFYRVERATEVRGIGLGLYVSKAIVESHGGEIRVSSEPGTGSTFSVILPALDE